MSRAKAIRSARPAAVLLAVLSGCAVADNLAQDQAKTVVNSVVESRFPGVNVAPVTDCVIEAASAGEIISLASAANSGVTQQTVETVLEISTRPEAVNCIAENGLKLLA
ncbi:MAG: succinate dehydrogenase [Pseudomonadota bacterium]